LSIKQVSDEMLDQNKNLELVDVFPDFSLYYDREERTIQAWDGVELRKMDADVFYEGLQELNPIKEN